MSLHYVAQFVRIVSGDDVNFWELYAKLANGPLNQRRLNTT